MQWDNLNDFERVEFFKTFNPKNQKIAIIQSTYVKMSLNLIVILHNKYNNKFLVNIDKGYNLKN